MEHKNNQEGLNVSVKSFLGTIAVVLALMAMTYVLTMMLPGGEYVRVTDENGNTVIDPNGVFTYC